MVSVCIYGRYRAGAVCKLGALQTLACPRGSSCAGWGALCNLGAASGALQTLACSGGSSVLGGGLCTDLAEDLPRIASGLQSRLSAALGGRFSPRAGWSLPGMGPKSTPLCLPQALPGPQGGAGSPHPDCGALPM